METSYLGLTVQPSTIKHEKAGLGGFAAKPFAENVLAGHYYGTFVYANLGGSCSTTKTYGEGFLSVMTNWYLK